MGSEMCIRDSPIRRYMIYGFVKYIFKGGSIFKNLALVSVGHGSRGSIGPWVTWVVGQFS